ncbi:MAG: hypothetical protein M2R45_03338 [Verrucomicrobia subdivision 3 bacterium]|nr:hypothetical protein [Limisphaerales bacterium]MCS1415380.1 hypothetical protein [Limisphaerales bacterium]
MAPSEDPENLTSPPGLSFSDSVYRCACGMLLKIDPTEGVECLECRQNYSALLLADQEGEKTTLATLCERRTRMVAIPGEEDSLLGQKWGHFRIFEWLRSGAWTKGCRALDESLQSYMALKVI